MTHRSLTCLGILGLVCTVVALAPATAAGQDTMPRATPMERPPELAGKETLRR